MALTKGKSQRFDPLGIKLNGNNVLQQAWKARDKMPVPKNTLKEVLVFMLENGWYIDQAWARQGSPDWYADVFETSCKEGKLTFAKSVKTWYSAMFRPVSSRW